MNVLIYTIKDCPYCIKAKQFFQSKGVSFTEYKIGVDITSEKYHSIAHRTAPAIFIDGNFIGGYDELMMLNTVQPETFS